MRKLTVDMLCCNIYKNQPAASVLFLHQKHDVWSSWRLEERGEEETEPEPDSAQDCEGPSPEELHTSRTAREGTDLELINIQQNVIY